MGQAAHTRAASGDELEDLIEKRTQQVERVRRRNAALADAVAVHVPELASIQATLMETFHQEARREGDYGKAWLKARDELRARGSLPWIYGAFVLGGGRSVN